VEPGAEAEVLVGGTGVAVDAAVLAAAVRVQAETKSDVGAVVLRQHAAADVAVVDGRIVSVRWLVPLEAQLLVAVRRVGAGAARANRRLGHFAVSSPLEAASARTRTKAATCHHQ